MGQTLIEFNCILQICVWSLIVNKDICWRSLTVAKWNDEGKKIGEEEKEPDEKLRLKSVKPKNGVCYRSRSKQDQKGQKCWSQWNEMKLSVWQFVSRKVWTQPKNASLLEEILWSILTQINKSNLSFKLLYLKKITLKSCCKQMPLNSTNTYMSAHYVIKLFLTYSLSKELLKTMRKTTAQERLIHSFIKITPICKNEFLHFYKNMAHSTAHWISNLFRLVEILDPRMLIFTLMN